MASEPYCDEAPSRSTSSCLRAIVGITDISGPCEPSEIPPPRKAITEARCIRLPLTSTSVLSGDKPRRLAGRTKVAASEIGWVLTLKDGTEIRIASPMSFGAWFWSSAPDTTSTGATVSAAERSAWRVPVTMI